LRKLSKYREIMIFATKVVWFFRKLGTIAPRGRGSILQSLKKSFFWRFSLLYRENCLFWPGPINRCVGPVLYSVQKSFNSKRRDCPTGCLLPQKSYKIVFQKWLENFNRAFEFVGKLVAVNIHFLKWWCHYHWYWAIVMLLRNNLYT
jgi:hypothetical protein